MSWDLGRLAPTSLVDARLQLHWAAQVVSAAADAWLPARTDDGHTTMRWDRPKMRGETGICVRVVDFAITFRERALPLAGTTLADAMAWADRELGPPRGMHARDYDMPPHPVATGAPFSADSAALAELARWYDAGADVLGDAGVELRIWPHHFDLGGILRLDAPREIGIGLSPGDGYHAEPYFYVTPYPLRSDPDLAPLAGGGFWHREGWTGAVLLGSAAVAGGHDTARAFLASAIAAARAAIA
jgi:hypothetical protein